MRNKLLLLILLLSSLLRIPFLDSHISALYGDEISIGYNAYSILQTAKDEFGKFLPIQFESWGDQKNPVYIYAVAIFEIVFGLTAWSVRLPSAISGILAVLLTYLITKQLFNSSVILREAKDPVTKQIQSVEQVSSSPRELNNHPTRSLPLLSALLLAISPWHIHISRGGYEANMAVTLSLVGVYYLLKSFSNTTKSTNQLTKNQIISLACFLLAMYTYYTTKLFLPLLIVLLWTWSYFFLNKTKQHIKSATIYLFTFIIFCLPIAYLALFADGQSRFNKINIFTNPTVNERVIIVRNQYDTQTLLTKLLINKQYYWISDFFINYADIISPSFWYTLGDNTLRYSIGNHGMFYLIEAPFFLLGLLYLFQKNKKIWLLLVTWLLLAVLPTALVGKSYGLRSLAILPIPMIFTSYGIVQFYCLVSKKNILITRAMFCLLSVVFCFSILNWLLRYAYLYPTYAYYWYDGMQKDAIDYAIQNQKEYDNIVISRYYGKTELYSAFYTKQNAQDYQNCSKQTVQFLQTEMIKCGKFYFGDLNTTRKSHEQLNLPLRTLIIGSPDAGLVNTSIIAKDDKRVLFKIITDIK